jgi:hypothetical protein
MFPYYNQLISFIEKQNLSYVLTGLEKQDLEHIFQQKALHKLSEEDIKYQVTLYYEQSIFQFIDKNLLTINDSNLLKRLHIITITDYIMTFAMTSDTLLQLIIN